MDRTNQIVSMARRMERSASRAEWFELESTDRELASWLRGLVWQGPFDSAERAALARLQNAHQAARERCRREVSRLSGVLAELRERRDGWLAYAFEGELERTEP